MPTGAGVRGQATHRSGALGLNTSTGSCERFLEEFGRDASCWRCSHRGGGRSVWKPYIYGTERRGRGVLSPKQGGNPQIRWAYPQGKWAGGTVESWHGRVWGA